jgi:hypothetical protein
MTSRKMPEAPLRRTRYVRAVIKKTQGALSIKSLPLQAQPSNSKSLEGLVEAFNTLLEKVCA